MENQDFSNREMILFHAGKFDLNKWTCLVVRCCSPKIASDSIIIRPPYGDTGFNAEIFLMKDFGGFFPLR
jgi:hypothetical protein